MAFFSRTHWVSRHQKGKTIPDFNEARDGLYANHMHLTPDITSTSSLNILQARCSSWCPTNSVKALKAWAPKAI